MGRPLAITCPEVGLPSLVGFGYHRMFQQLMYFLFLFPFVFSVLFSLWRVDNFRLLWVCGIWVIFNRRRETSSSDTTTTTTSLWWHDPKTSNARMNVHFITCFRMWSWDFARTRLALEFPSRMLRWGLQWGPFFNRVCPGWNEFLSSHKETQVRETCSSLRMGSYSRLLFGSIGNWIPISIAAHFLLGAMNLNHMEYPSSRNAEPDYGRTLGHFQAAILVEAIQYGFRHGCNLAVLFKAEGVKHLAPYNSSAILFANIDSERVSLIKLFQGAFVL